MCSRAVYVCWPGKQFCQDFPLLCVVLPPSLSSSATFVYSPPSLSCGCGFWQVVECNGLSSAQGGPINIVNSKVEETQDIGLDKVRPRGCSGNLG